ncbi:GNAT family N-acetyltransferase [Stenomitos frigidus]|uniref:N-acetyltransferase domain-containing protein n=1 Tax=Stenomitos frigidus ULC18 TaxID=2107698 RepID=A0A2T1ECT6_9CYAN|nr:GNAT family N-acetyltransferase [Stenomitos frigidus]PSB30518.1 hypothetical protein C7B82_08705 [Stenomitos frigidus ULC18]
MAHDQVELSPILILSAPSQRQIQVAAEWLANQHHQNPDLEIALHLILQKQIVPHAQGGLVAIAYSETTAGELTQAHMQGVVVAKPGNIHVSIASANLTATEALLSLLLARECPHRLCTSEQTKAWIRPCLLQHYQLQREYDQQVLFCTQPPDGAAGRWAVPQDKPTLQAYAAAYLAERGSGSLDYPWEQWIQQQRVAVLEERGQIVAVVRRAETAHHGIVVAPFTFPPFRRQGFARRLLAFLTQQLLQEFPAVKLWVDHDNTAAIALYTSLNFQPLGACYTGYYVNR